MLLEVLKNVWKYLIGGLIAFFSIVMFIERKNNNNVAEAKETLDSLKEQDKVDDAKANDLSARLKKHKKVQ